MNLVKAGFFSLTAGAHTDAEERSYLEWHQLDHMPEQYQIPGLVLGQRWASSAACNRARAAESDELAAARHVVCYLMTEPVGRTLDDFFELGRRLAELGRYPHPRRSLLLGAFHLLEGHAAPRTLISAEVVPFRPNRGVYLIVERPTDPGRLDGWLRWAHEENMPELVGLRGVAGAWSYASSPVYRRDTSTPGSYRLTMCYLDDEPATVGEGLRPFLERRWRDAPVEPLLAAPFETVVPWHWDRVDVGAPPERPREA